MSPNSPSTRYTSPDRDKKLPSLSQGFAAQGLGAAETSGNQQYSDDLLESIPQSGKLLYWDCAGGDSRLLGSVGKQVKNGWTSQSNQLAALLGGGSDDAAQYLPPNSLFEAASASPFSTAMPAHKSKGVYYSRAAVVAAATAHHSSHSPPSSQPSHPASYKKAGAGYGGGNYNSSQMRHTLTSPEALLREIRTSTPLSSCVPRGTTIFIGAQVHTSKESAFANRLFMSQQLKTPGGRSPKREAAHSANSSYDSTGGITGSGTMTARAISGRNGTGSTVHCHSTADIPDGFHFGGTAPMTASAVPMPMHTPSLPQVASASGNMVHHYLAVSYPTSPVISLVNPNSRQSQELQAAVALAKANAKDPPKPGSNNQASKVPVIPTIIYNHLTIPTTTMTPKAYYPKAAESPATLSMPLEKAYHPVLRTSVTVYADVGPPPMTARVTIGMGGRLQTAQQGAGGLLVPTSPEQALHMSVAAVIAASHPTPQHVIDLAHGMVDPRTVGDARNATHSPHMSLPSAPGTADSHPGSQKPFSPSASYTQPPGLMHASGATHTRYQIFTPQRGVTRLSKDLENVVEGVRSDLTGPTPVMAVPKSKFANHDRAGPLRILRPQDLLPRLVAQPNDPRPITPCITTHPPAKEKPDASRLQLPDMDARLAHPPLRAVPLPQVAMAASLASQRANPVAVRTPMYARRGTQALLPQKPQSLSSLPEVGCTAHGQPALPGVPPASQGAAPPARQSGAAQLASLSLADESASLLPANVVLDLAEVLGDKQPAAADTSAVLKMKRSSNGSSNDNNNKPVSSSSSCGASGHGHTDPLAADGRYHGFEPSTVPDTPGQSGRRAGMEVDTLLEVIISSLPERVMTAVPCSAAPSLGSRPSSDQQGSGVGGFYETNRSPFDAVWETQGVGGMSLKYPHLGLDPELYGDTDPFPIPVPAPHPFSAPVAFSRQAGQAAAMALFGADFGLLKGKGSSKGKGVYGMDGVCGEGSACMEASEEDDDYDVDDAEYVDLDDSDVEGYASTGTGLVSVSPYSISTMQHLDGAAATSPHANQVNDMIRPIDGVRVLGEKYEVQHMVGEGAYGMVTKCKVIGSDCYVAIKEFKIEDDDPDADDVKRTSKREVSLLRMLRHPNIVDLVDEFYVRDHLFIVMEFVPCNLLELLEAQPGGMDREAVRLIMYQMCTAMAFIHGKNIVFRDIKPENILVDEHGRLKLCDFGFARIMNGPGEPLTDYVATRWYRSPELLLGPPYPRSGAPDAPYIQSMYGPPVDMWAIGCVLGELMDGEPLFAGDSDLDQLYKVQQVLGNMAPEQQAMFDDNPHNTGIVFNIKHPCTLAVRYEGKMNELEIDFMEGLLHMDPKQRFTADQCLAHPYLRDLATADARRAAGRDSQGSLDLLSMGSPSQAGCRVASMSGLLSDAATALQKHSGRSSTNMSASTNGRPVFNSSGRGSRGSMGSGGPSMSTVHEPGPPRYVEAAEAENVEVDAS